MKRLLFAALLGLVACGPDFDDDPFAPLTRSLPLYVTDDPATLSDGKERLFALQYCANAEGPGLLVSELHTELETQGLRWRSGRSLRYELSVDADRDHRFGPGDVLTVSEGDWDEFGARDAGTAWKVRLLKDGDFGDEAVGEADWFAR